ncbi:YiiX/YebB-like N1pC/P60 family cysteine hydrolase [Brucella pseudogrignonensis]|uniref:YiiX/YebB-like N1pC/P60 family cysteine hydrolase n=1 Tax=Brucella pseudogrignonensis TaxID=419475 RepID=UPI0038B60B5D
MANLVQDPYYNNRTIYTLGIQDLRPGDIILTKNVRSKSLFSNVQSWIIRIFTSSNYSHAMLYTTPPTAIEAIKDGVTYTSIQRTFFHNMRNVRVLRHNNPQVANDAAVWASRAVGQSYALTHAIKLVVPSSVKTAPPQNATFCSALVIAAYQSTKQTEFMELDPFRISPGDIERMNIFNDVTSQVAKPILAPPNVELMSPLDGDRKPSPMDRQIEIYREIYLNTIESIKKCISENNLSIDVPDNYFSSLVFIFSIIKNKMTYNTSIIDIDNMFFHLMVDYKLEDVIKNGISHDEIEYKRQLNELENENPDIDLDNVTKLLEVTDVQISSRLKSIDTAIFPENISKSWDEYRKHQRLLIDALENRREVLAFIITSMKQKSAP